MTLNSHDIEILKRWIEAVRTFCNAGTPNFGKLSEVTIEAGRQFERRQSRFQDTPSHLLSQFIFAQEMLRARPYNGRDELDKGLLMSNAFVEGVELVAGCLATQAGEAGLVDLQQARAITSCIEAKRIKREKKLGVARPIVGL